MSRVYVLLVYSCLAFHISSAIQLLNDSKTFISPNGTYKLGFFSPQDSTNRYLGISYNKISPTFFVWVANRNNPLHDSSGVLRTSEDGSSLKIVNSKNETFWSFNISSPKPNTQRKIQLFESGNLCLLELDKAGNSTVVWQSFDYPTDTLLSSMSITVKNTTSTRLHAWKSPSNPSEGRFSIGLDSFTNPQLVIWDGNQRHSRTGPWNGNIFLGVSYTDQTNDYSDAYFQKNDALGTLTLVYTGVSKLPFSHYYFGYDGFLSEIWWDPDNKSWETLYKLPDDQCDFYGKCGEFGVCNSAESPICECLSGFVPENRQEWKSGNWSSGCTRRTPLQCESDGFVTMKTVKLPDFEVWLAEANPIDCRNSCLNNCSCVAYAYDNGAGCMYWSKTLIDIQQFTGGGVDLQLRMAHSELGTKSKLKSKSGIFVAVIVSIGSIITVVIFWILLYRWKGRKVALSSEEQASGKSMLEHLKHRDPKIQRKLEELPLIGFTDLVAATNNFHDAQLLGQGGFGRVYKGTLNDGREIAVKRLSAVSLQGEEEFMNEVIVISRLQHKNLVSLVGFCVQGDEKLLVYEYMPNTSLHAFLFDCSKREILDWDKRFNIIEGICRGLIYLHRDSRLRIIHRDLKASNILLDEQLNPKIADFGMARIFGHGQDRDETRRVVGTYGYMAPEYAMDGHFSEKSDVYSFGVLLLEILTAKKNNTILDEEESLTLLGYVWELWAEGALGSIINPLIWGPQSMKDIERFVQVGLLCVQENANDRPTISIVMSMFSSDIEALPRPKEPGFNRRHVFLDVENSQMHQFSGENVTVTVISGR